MSFAGEECLCSHPTIAGWYGMTLFYHRGLDRRRKGLLSHGTVEKCVKLTENHSFHLSLLTRLHCTTGGNQRVVGASAAQSSGLCISPGIVEIDTINNSKLLILHARGRSEHMSLQLLSPWIRVCTSAHYPAPITFAGHRCDAF